MMIKLNNYYNEVSLENSYSSLKYTINIHRFRRSIVNSNRLIIIIIAVTATTITLRSHMDRRSQRLRSARPWPFLFFGHVYRSLGDRPKTNSNLTVYIYQNSACEISFLKRTEFSCNEGRGLYFPKMKCRRENVKEKGF